MKLFIDDRRPSPEGKDWITARTYEDAMELLLSRSWSEVAFDHDLGDADETKTGYQLIKWIEEQAWTNDAFVIPEKITVHSDNGPGIKNINLAITSIDRAREKKLKKLPIYYFLMPNQFILTSTFLRFQETYESPKFRGQGFTLEEFQDWYASTNARGNFTYYQDWVGFNFPSHVIEGFTPARFGQFSRKENWVIDQLSNIPGDFYVIASVSRNKSKNEETKAHELMHAMFYLNKEYAKQVEEIIQKHDFTAFKSELKEMGYCDEVLVDEINAFVCTGLTPTLEDVDATAVAVCKPALIELFQNFFGINVTDNLQVKTFFQECVNQIDGSCLLPAKSI